MATIDQRWFKYIGWNSQGDLGPLTMYTNQKRKLVFFAKMPPLNPPSFRQVLLRERFRLLGQTWSALTPDQRDAWNKMAIKGRLRIHGYNLYSYWQLTRDSATIRTIQHQTGITVLP